MTDQEFQKTEKYSWSTILAIISIVLSIVTLCSVVWLALSMQRVVNTPASSSLQESVDDEQPISTTQEIFTDRDLHLSFALPPAWSAEHMQHHDANEAVEPVGVVKAGVSLRWYDSATFLHATVVGDDYPDHMGRGGFWGMRRGRS